MDITITWISGLDRKSTRLNSSHRTISYAVFCLKKNLGAICRVAARDRSGVAHHPAAGELRFGEGASVGLGESGLNPSRLFFINVRHPPNSTLFPHSTIFD